MNMGFLYGMVPTLDRPSIPDESDPKQLAAKKEAYHRHMAFPPAADEPLSSGPRRLHGGGVRHDPENFNPDSINAVKTSLMGPLFPASVTPFFQGTIRVIAFGLGVQLAQQGSIMGPIPALLISIVPSVLITWFAAKMGYQGGHEYLSKLQGGDLMEKLMYVCGIVGLMSVGGMIATLIGATTPLQFADGTAVIQTSGQHDAPDDLPWPHRPYVLAHQEERQHRLASRDRHCGRHRPLRGRHRPSRD